MISDLAEKRLLDPGEETHCSKELQQSLIRSVSVNLQFVITDTATHETSSLCFFVFFFWYTTIEKFGVSSYVFYPKIQI